VAGRGTVLAEAGEEGVRCQISPCLSQRGDRKEEIGEGKGRRREEGEKKGKKGRRIYWSHY